MIGSRDDHLMAADPRQGSRLPSRALFSGTLFLGAFRFARLCPLFVYDPGRYLFFPSFVSPLFLKFLFDLLVLAFSFGTCAARHTDYLRLKSRAVRLVDLLTNSR
jgi:hypothetical protein